MTRGLIIVPACNEATSLEYFLPRLIGTARKIPDTTIEIVVVDDGSTDNTFDVVKKRKCRYIRHKHNKGLGVCLRTGYQLAVDENCDFLASMDADGQHDCNLLDLMIDRLQNGADLVTASRYHPESERFSPPIDRDLLNIAFTAIIRSITGWQHITDPLTGFWAMKLRVAKFLAENLKLERYGTCLEGLIKLWYLCNPRPVLIEVPHPAVYAQNSGGILNRTYSDANREQRIERFGTHALHIVKILQDVAEAGHEREIMKAIRRWRLNLVKDL
ncbi:MAG: glycosyltransferase family 2 protein [Patescibacteria group bacterium]